MSLRNVFFAWCVLGVVCVALFSGCKEPEPAGMPKRYPASLKFTQDGAPCEGASVQLNSQDGVTWLVGGMTDSSGTATMITHGTYTGAPLGKYKITISKMETETEGPPAKTMYEVQKATTYHLIDPKFSREATTDLQVEIVPGTQSYGPFELGKKVHEEVQGPPGG